MPIRATGANLPSNSAKIGAVSDALLLHFNVILAMNAIWLTIVASCVVNDVDSTVGLVQETANDNEIIAENAERNNNFDMM